MDMEPAKTIIEYLGGAKSAAEIVRKHPSRIYRWAYPSTKREGCDGIIPLKDQRAILEFCQRVGINLRREDFFCSNRLRSILKSTDSESPASSSAGDDAGASVSPPAQKDAPVINSLPPEVLPSGEAVARCEIRQRATATNSMEAVR
ncbi:hypothetical protein OIV19_12115 [Brucella sp. HL-2]|nr:hypothetical protein [Brucella sp. HL-2]MCV9908358.1 hypothetical protein [Brucella sp. HL-2]